MNKMTYHISLWAVTAVIATGIVTVISPDTSGKNSGAWNLHQQILRTVSMDEVIRLNFPDAHPATADPDIWRLDSELNNEKIFSYISWLPTYMQRPYDNSAVNPERHETFKKKLDTLASRIDALPDNIIWFGKSKIPDHLTYTVTFPDNPVNTYLLSLRAAEFVNEGQTDEAIRWMERYDKVTAIQRISGTFRRWFLPSETNDNATAIYRRLLWMEPTHQQTSRILESMLKLDRNWPGFGKITLWYNLKYDNHYSYRDNLIIAQKTLPRLHQDPKQDSISYRSELWSAVRDNFFAPRLVFDKLFYHAWFSKYLKTHPAPWREFAPFTDEQVTKLDDLTMTLLYFGNETIQLRKPAGEDEPKILRRFWDGTGTIVKDMVAADLTDRLNWRILETAYAAREFYFQNKRWPTDMNELKPRLSWIGAETEPFLAPDAFSKRNVGRNITISHVEMNSKTIKNSIQDVVAQSFNFTTVLTHLGGNKWQMDLRDSKSESFLKNTEHLKHLTGLIQSADVVTSDSPTTVSDRSGIWWIASLFVTTRETSDALVISGGNVQTNLLITPPAIAQ